MFLEKDFILKEKYIITERLDCSGSTAVYFAVDKTTDKRVKVKEFFPQAIMQRNEDGSIVSKEDCEVQYKSLKSDFYELNNYIISISDIGGVLAPFDVFYENGSCYAVEEVLSCETLEDYLARNDGELNWQTIKKAVSPVVSALRKMHSDGYYHRGISPENIIIKDETMLLTGFDIPPARTNGSEIDSTLYFGFSAPEQYSSASWQGSWTDVYSLAAICYRALTGITPVEWRQRGASSKNLILPSTLNPSCPENVSNTLLTALSVDIRNRYRTIEEFWIGLLHGAGDTTIVVSTPKMQGHIKQKEQKDNVKYMDPKQSKALLYTMCAVFVVTVTILCSIIITLIIKQKDPPESASQVSSQLSQQESEASENEPEEILIPDFKGLSVADVMMNKNYTGLYNFEIDRAYSEIYSVGDIVSQYPEAGTEYIKDHNTVLLLISMGSERTTMPLVEGAPFDQAVLLLNELDIDYKIEKKVDTNVDEGTVIASSIPFKETVMRTKDVVTITVAVSESEDEESGEYE